MTGAVLVSSLILLTGCKRGVPTPGADLAPEAGQTDGQAAEGSEGAAAAQNVAATVNGQPIPLDEYDREMARFMAGRAALNLEVADESSFRQQVLEMMIDNELLVQEAERRGITVSDEEVEAEIQDAIDEVGQEYFDSYLEANAYTMDEYRDLVRTETLGQRLMEAVLADMPTTAEHVHARHILVTSESEAEALLERIQAGEDFAELAKEHSIDTTTRDRGGDLDWFPRGGLLVPEVEEAAFSLQPGEVSGVVASDWGYHIVQTLEFDPAREITSPETLDTVRRNMREQWLAQLRNAADIQRLVDVNS